MTVIPLQLRFQLGARTIASIDRRLVRVPLSLEEALAGRVPVLAPLDRGAHGYAFTSLPAALQPAVTRAGLIGFVRQRYNRYFVDLSSGFDAWFAGLSAGARATLRRKQRRLADRIDVRRYRTPDELAAFHSIARRVSQRTYQEKLLGAGLPDDPTFLHEMARLAAADGARGWLLHVDGAPAAYLFCTAQGTSLRYEYVGHDPAFAEWSPGQILQLEALRDLFAEPRFARFDFTEGEGQHKRQFATGHVPCVDLLLLRTTLANRATVFALAGFDRLAAWGKQAAQRPAFKGLAKKVRRA